MRVLSGIVAVLFLTVLFMQINQLPVLEAGMFAALGCLFAIYAVLEQSAADRWLSALGIIKVKNVRPPDDPG